MTYDDLINNHDSDPLEEFRRDAHQPTFNDLEEFAEYHPLSEYTGQAAYEMIHDDDQHCRLMEDCGPAVMRYLQRTVGTQEGLDRDYDTDQRMRDEDAISQWLEAHQNEIALRMQREEWEA